MLRAEGPGAAAAAAGRQGPGAGQRCWPQERLWRAASDPCLHAPAGGHAPQRHPGAQEQPLAGGALQAGRTLTVLPLFQPVLLLPPSLLHQPLLLLQLQLLRQRLLQLQRLLLQLLCAPCIWY